MIGFSQRNFKLCSIYSFCTALAIAVSANAIVTDLLFLNLKFDLAKFGIIKSCMFLLPSISYFASAGLLLRLNRDLTIAAQAYLWRVLLPLILTVSAFFIHSQTVLLVLASVIFSLSYTCAMFANNTLLKIYRNALSPSEFNRGSIFLTALLSMPGAVFCLLAVSILNRFSGDRQAFLLCLLVLQLVSLLFEYPAYKSLMAVRFPHVVKEAQKHSPKGKIADIFRSVELKRLLVLSTLHGIWTGAVSTYFVIYLLRVWQFKAQWIAALELLLTVLNLISAKSLGRLADRFGCDRVIGTAFAVILTIQLLWTSMPTMWIFLLFFCFAAHNGNGMLGIACFSLESSWSAALAKQGQHELFIAARTLLYSIGCFAGCQLAGPLLTLFPGTEAEQFLRYFRCTLLLPLLMVLLTLFRKK